MTRRPGWLAGAVVLLAVCMAVFLPGQRTIPPIDRDESRFAQASRQMAASGSVEGWIIPRIQDRPRLNKPPLIYWVQASAALLLSGGDIEHDEIWMYRVPSVIFASLAVFITWRLGVALFGGWCGLLGAIMLAVCPVLVAEAHQARSDHLLLALTTAAMAALWRTWRRETPGLWTAVALWAFVGLGMMVKGPVTPMVVGLTALMLSVVERDAGWLKRTRPLLGVSVLVVLVTPWVALATREVGLRTLLQKFVDEVLVRSGQSREGHWGPPGYHLVLLVLLFWPGSMLTAAAVTRALDRGIRRAPRPESGESFRAKLARVWRTRRRGRRAELFCIAWVVPSWIVFEFVSTKLPHYTLPMYPALALLSARAVIAQARWIPAAKRTMPKLGFGLWLAVGLFLIGATAAGSIAGWRGGWMPGAALAVALAASAIALALAIASGVCAMSFDMRRSTVLSISAAVVSFAALMGALLPHARPLWISPRIMDLVGAVDPDGQRPLASERYQEDSLIYLSRGRLERLADGAGGEWLAAHPDGLLIIPSPRLEAFGQVVPFGHVTGFNYSSGKAADLALVRAPD